MRVILGWKMQRTLAQHKRCMSSNMTKCVDHIIRRENVWMKHIALFAWRSFVDQSKSQRKMRQSMQEGVEMVQKNTLDLEKKTSSKLNGYANRVAKMVRHLHSGVSLVLQKSQRRIELLQLSVKIITDGRDSMKGKLRLAEEEISRLKKENQRLDEEIETAKVLQVRMRKECKTLASESVNTRKSMDTMTKKQTKMEDELKLYKRRLQEIEKTIDLTAAPHAIQTSIDSVSGDLKDLKSILGDAIGQWDAVQSSLDTIRVQIPASVDEATAHSINILRVCTSITCCSLEEMSPPTKHSH
jgi:chromosome segregation ATPase